MADDSNRLKPLIPLEKAFVASYLADPYRRGWIAYRDTHPKASKSTCYSGGSQWLAKPHIVAEIERLEREVEREVIERGVLSREEVVSGLREVLGKALGKVKIRRTRVKPDKQGRDRRLVVEEFETNLPAANAALQSMARVGGFMKDTVEVEGLERLAGTKTKSTMGPPARRSEREAQGASRAEQGRHTDGGVSTQKPNTQDPLDDVNAENSSEKSEDTSMDLNKILQEFSSDTLN